MAEAHEDAEYPADVLLEGSLDNLRPSQNVTLALYALASGNWYDTNERFTGTFMNADAESFTFLPDQTPNNDFSSTAPHRISLSPFQQEFEGTTYTFCFVVGPTFRSDMPVDQP